MSQKQVDSVKPFISILLVMGFLFGMAFLKMENRRLGYSFMSLANHEKEMRRQQREKVIQLSMMTGPERVQYIATQKLPLRKASDQQVIQMTGEGVAYLQ